MPSVPSSWFAANFGQVPASFQEPGSTPEWYTSRGMPVPAALKINQPPSSADVFESWYQDNRPGALAPAQKSANQAQGSQAKKMTQERAQTALIRSRLLAASALKTAKVTKVDDFSPFNDPTKEQIAASPKMITPSSVEKDLGRPISNADPFWTGQFKTTEEVTYGRPRNKWEMILDQGAVTGRTQSRTPITQKAVYADESGAAMRYAQQRRLNQQDIQNWQAFFVNSKKLTPGSFVFGAWDRDTQAAMYNLMGEANAMGQTVDAYKMSTEATWKAMGGTPSGGFAGSGGGAGSAPRNTTQTVYSITSLAKGSEMIRAYLQRELGRDPNKAEIAAYVRLLNGQERKNPQITSTSYSANGSSSTSTSKEANVDPENTAHDFVAGDMAKELEGRKTMEYMSALAGM